MREGRKPALTDNERSAMWHARQRAKRKGLPFHLQDELIRYRAKTKARDTAEEIADQKLEQRMADEGVTS